MKIEFDWLCRLAILMLLSFPGVAQNTTIYSNFLPGNTFVCCGGEPVAGAPGSAFFGVAGPAQAAAPFTPTGNFRLTQIDLPLDFVASPTYTGGFNLSLNGDSGGVPGAALETWAGLVAPIQKGGTSSLVTTVFPAFTVPLLAGNQYWIVASPAASTTCDLWLVTSDVGTGPGGRMAYDDGAGWVIQTVPTDGLAFDVSEYPPHSTSQTRCEFHRL